MSDPAHRRPMTAAVELLLDGRVKVAPLVEHHPLSEIDQVFEAVHAGRLSRRDVLLPDARGDMT